MLRPTYTSPEENTQNIPNVSSTGMAKLDSNSQALLFTSTRHSHSDALKLLDALHWIYLISALDLCPNAVNCNRNHLQRSPYELSLYMN